MVLSGMSTVHSISLKAMELVRIWSSPIWFSAPNSWVRRFMRRKGLSLHRRTFICQKLPEEFEDKPVSFQRYAIRLRQENYTLGQMGNADETPIWFDMPSSSTIAERGGGGR